MPTSQTPARQSAVYECLSRSRRRYALHCLRAAEKPLSLADLAGDVAEMETDEPRTEIDEETVERVYQSLYHVHVPKLADADFVEFDSDRGLVSLSTDPLDVLGVDRELLAE